MLKSISVFFLLVGTFLTISFTASAGDSVVSATEEKPKNRCFRVYDITGFEGLDDYHVFLRGRTQKRNYLAQASRRCRDIDFTSKITVSFENQLVCPPMIEFIHSSNDNCPIKFIEKVANKDTAKAIVAKRAKLRQEKADARAGKTN
ncbi:MAG: hypothetical protein JKY46_06785 [Robiginitomaculum sp.]|nr:hypothetical protein [Robiginitomaculum sp.]